MPVAKVSSVNHVVAGPGFVDIDVGAGNDRVGVFDGTTGFIGGGAGRDLLYAVGAEIGSMVDLSNLDISGFEELETRQHVIKATRAQLEQFDQISSHGGAGSLDPGAVVILADDGVIDVSAKGVGRSGFTIYAHDGGNAITTGRGADNLYGSLGADILKSGSGNDHLDGGGGNDRLDGGAGNDEMLGGIGDDLLFGDAGNDYLDGGDGIDRLYGGAGRDTLIGGRGDLLSGDAGDDRLLFSNGFGRLEASGGSGDDAFGESATTFNIGLTLHGDGGRDTFTFDFLQASQLDGGADRDVFSVRTMSSGTMAGGSGNDSITIGNGLGRIYGGDGNDVISVGAAKITTYIFGDAGNDTISVGVGAAIVEGGSGNDRLTSGNDFRLQGRLDGGDGNDQLVTEGNDVLLGGTGRDVLESAGFKSTLTGGIGSDIFVYGDLVRLDSVLADTITDFSKATHDFLDLSALIERVGGAADPFGGGWLSFNNVGGSTEVLFDQDGGADGFQTLAVLQDVILTQADSGFYLT